MRLSRLKILVSLWRLFQWHCLPTQESHFLLLLHEKLECVFENGADWAAAEGHSDVLAVEEQAIDFEFLGAEYPC